MRTVKVLLMDDDSELSLQIPALKWIAFEARIDDKLYFFHDGRWFAVARNYESRVRAEATRILRARSPLALPAWPDGTDEKDYNKLVARQDKRYLVLARDLIRTLIHPAKVLKPRVRSPSGGFYDTPARPRTPRTSQL